jgi:hypothetical protein
MRLAGGSGHDRHNTGPDAMPFKEWAPEAATEIRAVSPAGPVSPAGLYHLPGCITCRAVSPAGLYHLPGCITCRAVSPAGLYHL